MHYDRKLTRKVLLNSTVIFYPDTEEEAAFIQERLFAMGFTWESRWSPDSKKITHLDKCTALGMSIQDGIVYANAAIRKKDEIVPIFIATSDQLSEDYVSPREHFNALAKKIERMEQMIETLYKNSHGGFNKGSMSL